MNVSFDGLRRKIADDFNDVCNRLENASLEEVKEALKELRGSIGGLLCCYDPQQQPKDFNMLADDIDLYLFRDEENEDE